MTRQVMVRVEEDLHDELKRMAEAAERTVSQTIRLAIKEYVTSERAKGNPK